MVAILKCGFCGRKDGEKHHQNCPTEKLTPEQVLWIGNMVIRTGKKFPL